MLKIQRSQSVKYLTQDELLAQIESYGPFSTAEPSPPLFGGFRPDTSSYSYSEAVILCRQLRDELTKEYGGLGWIHDSDFDLK